MLPAALRFTPHDLGPTPGAILRAVDAMLGADSPLGSGFDYRTARCEYMAYDWAPRLAVHPENHRPRGPRAGDVELELARTP